MQYERIYETLQRHGQTQLLRFYEELSREERQSLLEQIERLNWDALESEPPRNEGEISPINGLGIREINARREEYFTIGKEAIKSGKVAAVLLAGGQGTRLGSNAPKGTYNIGISRPLYIFQCLIENLQKVCAACGAYVPLFIMTSEKNDSETRAFFSEHGYFGYPEQCIRFFIQDMNPCTDADGKILLEEKDKIALSPSGNGGWYSSLQKAGLTRFADVEWYNVFSVDNVLQGIADPVFLGATIASGKRCGSKVVRKTCPQEKVGVLCLRGGLPDIIEYYELTDEMANAQDEHGALLYGYGVTLNYLFRADRLEETVGKKIPVHRVCKKVAYLDETGKPASGDTEAYKYETLILDMVKLMGSCLPFEVEREKEFAPVKNLTGVDSVDTARVLLRKNGVEL